LKLLPYLRPDVLVAGIEIAEICAPDARARRGRNTSFAIG
jgi:hypothetical protein